MRLQPYREKDAEYIVTWTDDAKSHAKWCANLLPYPLTKEVFHETLLKYQQEKNHLYFTAVTDEGRPVGFFFIIPKYEAKQAYMGFVIVDKKSRGKGCGREMMRLAFQYIFTVLNMESATLRVYDNNEPAFKMYTAAGMKAKEHIPEALIFGEEKWGAYVMEVKSAQCV